MRRYLGLRGKRLRAVQLWGIILPAFILFGYNNVTCGQVLRFPSWRATFPQLDTVSTIDQQKTENSRMQAVVISTYTIGCFFGAMSCMFIGDRLGRISTIQLGAGLNLFGAVLQACSFSLPELITGRLVMGLGYGMLSATAPNWQSECAKPSRRGAAVLFCGLFSTTGLCISAWINVGMSRIHSSVSWRFPMGFGALCSLIVVLLIPFFPESPHWLLKQGRVQDARQAWSALEDIPEDDPEISAGLAEIAQSLAVTDTGRFRDMFKNGKLRLLNRACLAAAGQLFHQMSDLNCLVIYVDTIFQQRLGLSPFDSRVVGAAAFTFQLICSPIGIMTVDRWGRRKLMMASAGGMGICMAVIGFASNTSVGDAASVEVAGAFLFLFSFFMVSVLIGLAFLYATEITPISHRTQMTSISTGSMWFCSILNAENSPVAVTSIGPRYFIIYAFINVFIVLPAVYFLFPETCGRHLEEVDAIFGESHNSLDPVRIARSLPKRDSGGPRPWFSPPDIDFALVEKKQVRTTVVKVLKEVH